MIEGINSLFSNPIFQTTQPYAALLAQPLGFVDIGARGGVHPLVEPIAGATSVLAFDADESECKRMEMELSANSPFALIQIVAAAIAGKNGPATLYQFVKSTNDSLLPENANLVKRYNIKTRERIGIVNLQTQTLDEILFGENRIQGHQGELLKIDAQGTELDILTGAERTLNERTTAIFVEVSFYPLYDGSSLFSELEIFLRSRGFFFYGFDMMHTRSCGSFNKLTEQSRERILWTDAVFFKDPIPTGLNHKTLSERGVYTLFVNAILTGYNDFALELATKTWADGEEKKRIEKLVHTIAQFPAKDTYQQVMDLADKVRANPDRANFEVGRFVDNRRWINDYDNVFPYRQI